MPDATERVDDAEDLAADEVEEDLGATENDRILERTTQSLMQSLVVIPGFERGVHVEVSFRKTTVAARKKGGGKAGDPKMSCASCITMTYPDGTTTTHCVPAKCPPPEKIPGES
jgi:hypothetical protein